MTTHDNHGWLLLDKPPDITSAKAVAIIRKHWHRIKAGHGGTLDPFATGLLPIAFGEATKTSSYVMGHEKRYEFTVLWGEETDTLDSEGSVNNTSSHLPTREAITSHLPLWTGSIMQAPPAYSAIKIKGKRAYSLARMGKNPQIPPRPVYIKSLSLLSLPSPRHACFAMTCGKGVYVRSLARDLAQSLKTCATVIQLRRTHVGNFSPQHTLSLERILEIPYSTLREASGDAFWSLDRVLSFLPAIELDEERALRWRQGRSVACAQLPHFRSQGRQGEQGRQGKQDEQEENLGTSQEHHHKKDYAVWSRGQVIGLARCEAGHLRVQRVFNRPTRPLYAKGTL